MSILAIDPGNEYSGYAILDDFYRPLAFGKVINQDLEEMLSTRDFSASCDGSVVREGKRIACPTDVIIEMISSYGSIVGASVFMTCVEIGRLAVLCEKSIGITPEYVKRKEYVTDLCGTPRAKDGHVIQYLVDRFVPDEQNKGKGTKKNPGWFYGVKADVWQAIAIGVWFLDARKGKVKTDVL